MYVYVYVYVSVYIYIYMHARTLWSHKLAPKLAFGGQRLVQVFLQFSFFAFLVIFFLQGE